MNETLIQNWNDTVPQVLFRIAVDRHDVLIIFLKINLKDTVSRPAPVREER